MSIFRNLIAVVKYLTLIVLLICFGWSCSKTEGNSSTAKKPEIQTIPSTPKSVLVNTVEVKNFPLHRKVELVGSLMADEEVTVSSELDNRIERVAVDLGDRVKKGDLLIKLADEELRLKVDEANHFLTEAMAKLGIDEKKPVVNNPAQTTIGKKAQADLDDAQLNYDRISALVEQKIISKQELDNAETRLKIAKANYDAAIESVKTLMATLEARKATLALVKKKLSDTVIRAPIDGAVSKRSVSGGEYVKVGSPLITLVTDNPLRLRGSVPERYSSDIKVGQEVNIFVEPFPGENFKGKVSRISPSSNIDTRSITLEASIPNSKLLLKPGFFAKATLTTKIDEQVTMVPNAAVYTFAGVNKIFIIADGKAQQRFVKLGARNGELVEILEGAKPGELVATNSLSKLEDQVAVTIKKEEN